MCAKISQVVGQNIGNQEQTIQGVENINSAADLANLNIPLGNGNNIRLGNIAQVRDSTAEIRQMAFYEWQADYQLSSLCSERCQ